MADYNIYIHNVNGDSNSSSPTKAWKKTQDSPTKAWDAGIETADASEMVSDSTSSVSALKGIGAAVKSHPVVAAAIVVTTLTLKAIDTITPFVARETGDYTWSVFWGNAKNTINSVLKPFSTAHGFAENYQETKIFNKAQEQQRLLIGESYTNSTIRRF